MTRTTEPVLIAGQWRASRGSGSFQVENPAAKEKLAPRYPISERPACDEALGAATGAADALRSVTGDRIGQFLERFADRIEKRKEQLVETAHVETALPKAPRLADVELPRTTNQLRQAAAAARDGSWSIPTIDTKA